MRGAIPSGWILHKLCAYQSSVAFTSYSDKKAAEIGKWINSEFLIHIRAGSIAVEASRNIPIDFL